MLDLAAVKDRIVAEVAARADDLVAASHRIHEHPELNFEERFAHDELTALLDAGGMAVERHAYGLDTAFVARAGTEGPLIAVLCEYDALPEIGHACGHNIIGTAGVGAGLAAAALADELGGRVVVLGTPAEEGGGGKILMAEQGAFDGVDAAMMIHPAGADLVRMDVIAVDQFTVSYEGEAAHAAAFPWKGRNALDAAVLGYMNVAALRQHIRPTERVHGIFTHGGDKPNIVPKYAETLWYVRSGTIDSLDRLTPRVVAALEAGAAATGCTCTRQRTAPVYADMLDNGPMVELYRANAARTGREPIDPAVAGTPVVGSTDMGNVSYLVPSIHPMIKVAPPQISIHTPEFAAYAAAPAGDQAVVDGATAMALTVADLWLRPEVLGEARTAFATATGRAARR
jgi:amidohydrolase